MKTHLIATAAAGLTLSVAAVAMAQPAPAPAPKAAVAGAPIAEAVKPTRISGIGITVTELEKMRDWYRDVLGMKQVGVYPPSGGAPYEYIMAMKADRSDGAVLALLRGRREPGATTYGRIIFGVPNAAAIAAYITDHGGTVRKINDNAYFVKDPEGNDVEFYQPPAAQ